MATKKLFDNSKLQQEVEWGNIPVGNLTDEELHTKNWNKVTANKEAAQRPEIKVRNQAGQTKRKESGWNTKMLGNQNAQGNKNRLGMINSVESNQRRSKALQGIVRENLRGISKPKETCPHCGKIGGRPQMIQFHFDKCKHK